MSAQDLILINTQTTSVGGFTRPASNYLPRQASLQPAAIGTLLATLCATLLLPATGMPAEPVTAVSVARPGLPASSSAQGDSFTLAMTPDGAFVLFVSTASNLETNDHNSRFDLFLNCRTNGITRLVSVNSVGTSGGAGNTIQGEVTPDGRHVVFQSDADDLVTNDLNGVSDIFTRDMTDGTTTLVSVNFTGTGSANGASSSPVITPDGRFVAFVSTASDLVAGDTNRISDVFVRDLETSATTLVSVGARSPLARPYALMDTPVITPDGRFVAFSSSAQGLASTPASVYQEIYVRDLLLGLTLCASTNLTSGSTPASYAPVLSDDGRFVAFKTAPEGTIRPWLPPLQLLRRDLQNGHLDLISTNQAGIGQAALDSYGPVMTPDGRFVAFTDSANSTNCSSVWLWDAQTQAAALVSVNLLGQPSLNGLCDSPALTPDGRYVVFLSNGTDLVTNAVNSQFHAYVRDMQSGVTLLASADPSGQGSGAVGLAPMISADGRVVGFDSPSDSLVPGDLNNASDAFIRNAEAMCAKLISTAHPDLLAVTANGRSTMGPSPFSANGRLLVFQSLASDLVPGDTNGLMDVFVRDLVVGTNGLISVSRFGTVSTNGASRSPSISADGRYVVFMSTSADLVDNDINRREDVFVRDLETGTTTQVSVGMAGSTPNGASTAASISPDGRWVAIQSQANNLAAGDTDTSDDIFVRDLVTGSATFVSRSLAGDTSTTIFTGPLISADGRWVAFEASSPTANTFRLADLQAGTLAVLAQNPSCYAFSDDGRILALIFTGGSSSILSMTDLVEGTRTVLVLGTNAVSSTQGISLSADGRFVAFSSRGNLVTQDTNGVEDVFLLDRQTGSLSLMSIRQSGDTAGNGRSYWPRLSSDGRYIAFRSAASDLVDGDDNGVDDVFLLDRRAGQIMAASHGLCGGATGNGPSTGLAFAPDRALLVFDSLASDLVSGDLNGLGDVFTAATSLSPLTDSDNDGLEDAWELQFFGNLTHDGTADSDSDGLSDSQEYRAGTDPTDATSGLKLGNVTLSNGVVTVNWVAAPGRSYRLQYNNQLTALDWLNHPGRVVIVGSHASVADNLGPGVASRFYRLLLVE